MKESYKVRPSQSPWPRVMRRVGQPAGRSVHRGTTGLCIELRKHPFVVADLVLSRGRQQSCRTINGESDVTPTESKTTGTVGNFPHGSRETPATSASPMAADRSEKARGHKSDTHVAGESDSSIVPEKPANKGRRAAACGVGGGKGTDQGEHRAIATGPDTAPELGRDTVRTQVAWIAGCT